MKLKTRVKHTEKGELSVRPSAMWGYGDFMSLIVMSLLHWLRSWGVPIVTGEADDPYVSFQLL